MDIIIFSDNKAVRQFFSNIERSKKFALQQHPCTELKNVEKKFKAGSFIYYDISNSTQEQIKRAIKFLESCEKCQFGIIDPTGTSSDIASYFHHGASDYIGKLLIREQLTEKRLLTAADFGTEKQKRGRREGKEVEKPHYILSGDN